jgi:hypothetical protein
MTLAGRTPSTVTPCCSVRLPSTINSAPALDGALTADSNCGFFGSSDGSPSGRPAFHPIRDQVNFLLRQCLIVANIAESFYRGERRHAALQHFFLDGFGPGTRLLECS